MSRSFSVNFRQSNLTTPCPIKGILLTGHGEFCNPDYTFEIFLLCLRYLTVSAKTLFSGSVRSLRSSVCLFVRPLVRAHIVTTISHERLEQF